MAKKITAYCMATKKKGVEMLNPVIDKAGNKTSVHGTDKAGNKMFTFMSVDTAKEHIKDGSAKKGKGW